MGPHETGSAPDVDIQGDVLMSFQKARIAGLVGVVLAASTVRAQPPAGLPGGTAVGPPAADAAVAAIASPGGGVAAAAVPAAPKSLWGLFGLSAANLQACKAKLCQSQLGLMINNMLTGPAGTISGGIVPPLCPPAPSAAAVAAMAAVDPAGPNGAKVVAAKIQQSEADAKARVVAVEYLGTVDCTHWPEATKALKNALRNDPNECVRFAAARVLGSGCCCSKEIIDALRICVSGEDTDGNAPETSARVKAAAFSALQNCLMRVPEALPVEAPPVAPPPPPREPGVPEAPPIPAPPREGAPTSASSAGDERAHLTAAHFTPVPRPVTYQERLRRKTYAETIEEASRTLFRVAQDPRQGVPGLPAGKRDVFHALMKARDDLRPAPRPEPTTALVPRDQAARPVGYVTANPAGPGGPPPRKPGSASTGSTESLSSRGLFGLFSKPGSRPSGD
jgi:hypothetical protein